MEDPSERLQNGPNAGKSEALELSTDLEDSSSKVQDTEEHMP